VYTSVQRSKIISVDQLTATEYPNMSTQKKIVEALHVAGKMSTEQLALQLNVSASAIQKNAKALIEAGTIARPAKGFYEIVRKATPTKKAKAAKAPKAEVPAYDGPVVKEPKRGELSQWIRDQLNGGTEVAAIVAHGAARFPSLQVTTGLVNWLRKKSDEAAGSDVDPLK
jgi:DNA-binding Lrp family transcriptional regulator